MLLSLVDWRVLFAGLLICAATVVFKRRERKRREEHVGTEIVKNACTPPDAVPLSHKQENGASRPSGLWNPVEFDYPKVDPCQDKLEDVKPIPYRPFKWGEYFVTMGLRSMRWDEWIELDQEFFQFYAIREHRMQTRRNRLVQTLPATPGLVESADPAAKEFVQELAEYLSARFPAVYSVKRHPPEKDASGWYGQPAIKEITIIPLQKTFSLDDEDPMVISALLTQEDLAIMMEGSDGRYYLRAGAILIPGMWRLRDKIGMSLDEIHLSGAVPQFESKLQLSMSRFFKRLPVDKPVVRNNYSLQVIARPEDVDPLDPEELSWAKTMKGDEDVDEGYEPGFLRAEGGNGGEHLRASNLENLNEAIDPSRVRLRVERQTLRRLPKTGAIVFTIRVYMTPVEELVKEPDAPGRLASAIRSWPEDVARYKARPAFESLLGYLDERHAEQLKHGITTNRVSTS